MDMDFEDYRQRIKISLIRDGRKIEANVVAINTAWDIAILQSEIDVEPFLLDIASMQIGDDILTIGSPHGFENNVSFGNVGSIGKSIYKKYGYLSTLEDAKKFAPQASVGGEYTLPDTYFEIIKGLWKNK